MFVCPTAEFKEAECLKEWCLELLHRQYRLEKRSCVTLVDTDAFTQPLNLDSKQSRLFLHLRLAPLNNWYLLSYLGCVHPRAVEPHD